MSNTKHTPGPWAVSTKSEAIRIVSKHGTFIVQMTDEFEVNLANARLIASAPEVVATAQALLEVYLEGTRDVSEQHKLWSALEKALIKSGGK